MFELNLPLPPSINEYLPSKQGNSHPVVRAFTRQADLHLPEQQSLRKIEPVVGPFEFEVVLDRARRRNGDVDNRATKAFLDWLQRVKLIGNDRDCERIVACWGDAPTGSWVRVKAAPPKRRLAIPPACEPPDAW